MPTLSGDGADRVTVRTGGWVCNILEEFPGAGVGESTLGGTNPCSPLSWSSPLAWSSALFSFPLGHKSGGRKKLVCKRSWPLLTRTLNCRDGGLCRRNRLPHTPSN